MNHFGIEFGLPKGIPKRIGEEILIRYYYTCQGCFTPQVYNYAPHKRGMFGVSNYCVPNIELQLNHLVKTPIGPDESKNLRPLCRVCHNDYHRLIDHYYTVDYLRKIGLKALADLRRKKKKLRDRGLLSADFD